MAFKDYLSDIVDYFDGHVGSKGVDLFLSPIDTELDFARPEEKDLPSDAIFVSEGLGRGESVATFGNLAHAINVVVDVVIRRRDYRDGYLKAGEVYKFMGPAFDRSRDGVDPIATDGWGGHEMRAAAPRFIGRKVDGTYLWSIPFTAIINDP